MTKEMEQLHYRKTEKGSDFSVWKEDKEGVTIKIFKIKRIEN